jgi:equilibrative nucleoside transporter 1/2/3
MLKSLKSRLFGKSVEDEASTRLLGDRSLDQWKQEPIDKYNLVYWVSLEQERMRTGMS